MNEVLNILKEMNIKYEIVNHPEALDTELADKYIEGYEGIRSKTMFLTDKKKKNFYMLIMDDHKRVDFKTLNEILNNKVSMASEELLKEKLGLIPGMVSLFGLLNNKEHDVKIYIDKEVLNDDIITFFPNDNHATLFIKVDDMLKFINNMKYQYEIIEF